MSEAETIARKTGETVIAVNGLHVVYRVGFFMRQVHAVRGISFDVRRGEIVGLIGPNGSGKTSTVKCLMGLCRPAKGETRILGLDSQAPSSRAQVGFLPESPYVYPYLTPREFVDLCARLSSVEPKTRAARVAAVLERTGITYAADRPVGKLSKGMLQRAGLAAALVADPQILVLDEPMSGLDPIGRREVRDLIFEERRAGRTVLFSSHVLSDVETLCDRVVILRKGEIAVEGAVRDLVRHGAKLTELTLRDVGAAARAILVQGSKILRETGSDLAIEVEGDERLAALIAEVLPLGAKLVSAVPRIDSLEDLFIRNAGEEHEQAAGAAP